MSTLGREGRRILNGALPGRIKTVDDSGPVQLLQVDHGPQGPGGSLSIHDKLPRVAQFGFFSTPPADADVFVVCIGGDRGNAVAVATGHQSYRQKNVPAGDAGIHDQRMAYVWLTADGPVIDAAGGAVKIQNATTVTIDASDSPGLVVNCDVQINGNLSVSGAIDATDDVTGDGTSLHTHIHDGVTTGGGDTGAPV